MTINYKAIQSHIVKTLTENGVACTITARDNSTLTTVCVFDTADWSNIDNRQNPTSIIGMRQVAYVPGNVQWPNESPPDAAASLTYKAPNGSTVTRRIDSVAVTQPGSVPLMYTLVLE